MKALVGMVVVALHALGFIWIEQRSRGDELAVDISQLHLDGGPGLVRQHWTRTYRGGFTRDVGVTQLVGPFQDPAKPACTGRIVIGQSMLSDQLAPIMQKTIDEQLRGLDVFPVGKYRSIQHLGLEWARAETHAGDRAVLGKAGAPNGYIRATARVSFDRVDVPVVVAIVPEQQAAFAPTLAHPIPPLVPAPAQLHFRIGAFADLDFDNRVLDWVSDKVGADQLASRIAREQIDDVLVTTFAPPPPFDLGGGQTLQFTFCDGPVEIADHEYGALPFGVHIEGHAGLLPPQFGHIASAPPTTQPAMTGSSSRASALPTTQLAIDLDVDALNAMLFELWRTGWLDARLAEVGLDRTFNADPTVTEYLSIRISPVKLALPPVISPGAPGKLRLAADARVTIEDGAATVGRVYGALDFTLDRSSATGSRIDGGGGGAGAGGAGAGGAGAGGVGAGGAGAGGVGAGGVGAGGAGASGAGASGAGAGGAGAATLSPSVDLGVLEVACERRPNILIPCYSDLVAALRDRGGEFHGALTDAFAKLLTDIFVDRRLGAEGLPADLVITAASASLGGPGTLHLELTGKLMSAP